MDKRRKGRLPIGYVGQTQREIVSYNESRSNIYVIRCLSCGSTVVGDAQKLKAPCKKCSYKKKVALQDLREQIYWKYKYNANLKSVPFEITLDEFKEVIRQNCFYCGKKPSRVWRSKRKYDNEVVYTGIDRVNNSEGYVKNNYVPCCSECNYIKKDIDINEFKAMVRAWSKRVDNW